MKDIDWKMFARPCAHCDGPILPKWWQKILLRMAIIANGGNAEEIAQQLDERRQGVGVRIYKRKK